MEIAIVADETIPVEEWSRDPHVLAEGLSAMGHHVTLLLVATDEAVTEPGARTRAAPDGLLSPSPAEAQRGLALFTVRPEVVLSLGMSSPAIAAVLAESLAIPLAVCLPPELFGARPPAVGYGRLLCRHLPCALLLVESDRQATTAARLGADAHKIFVVRPGMRLDEFVVPPGNRRNRGVAPDDRLRLLFDASRNALRDQQFLEEVLTQLATERSQCFNTVVLSTRTDGGEPALDLRDLWQGRPDTTLIDLPYHRGVPEIYSGSDVVVMPSVTTDETASILRAMAAGRAIVAADCPPTQDLVTTARIGMLARAGSVNEWVDKLDYLLNGAALRLCIGRSARARVETHFSLPQTLSQLETRLGHSQLPGVMPGTSRLDIEETILSAQQNGTIWADGALREWHSVSVPLMSDAVLRSVAVFEGIRADMTDDRRVRLLGGSAHVERLLSSARALRIPIRYGLDEILEAAATVARAELSSTGRRVAYVRPMALGAALTEESGPCSLTIAAFAQEDRDPGTVRMQISSLRRPAPDSLPPQVKAVANYQLTRLARITARAAGYDDAIFLNPEGRLAEAAGAAVIVERQGRVITPPDWDGCLRSISVDVIERIAAKVNVPFIREPITLSTLCSADGIALAGTLADLVDVTCLDDLAIPAGPGIATLRRHYREAMSGGAFAGLLDFAEFPAVGQAAATTVAGSQ